MIIIKAMMALLALVVVTGGVIYMNSAVVITNPGNNNQVDLTVKDTVGGAEIAFSSSLGDPPFKNFSTLYSFVGDTMGATSIMGAIGGDFGHYINWTCDTSDNDGPDTHPGFCWTENGGILVEAGQKMMSPNFQFSVIYSGAETPIPPASAGNKHMRACVSDSVDCTNGTIYSGGAGSTCEVFSNGSTWIETGIGC